MVKYIPDRTGRFSQRPHYAPKELDRECENIIAGFLKERHGAAKYPVSTDDLTVLTKGRSQHVASPDGGWAVKPEGGQRALDPRRRLTATTRFSATSIRSSSSTDGTADSASGTATVTSPIRRRAEALRARTVQARPNIGD